MKFLIAISSCGDFEANGNNQALRDTWLKDLARYRPTVDYKFFFGEGQGIGSSKDLSPSDGILLPGVPDGYGHLTYKTQASLRWAHAEGYDFVFRCFPDTYVRLDRLMACPFWNYDYYGDFRSESTEQHHQNYASGGPGYWLSRRAFELLLDQPILGIWRDTITPYAEDLWVGNRLGIAPVKLSYFDDKRFVNKGSVYWPNPGNDAVTAHMSCPDRYHKGMMYAAHEAYNNWKS
jgi:hypothetical protein